MRLEREHHRTSFAWQGALILFPVLLLTCLAIGFIRQDIRLARDEAREHARELAGNLVGELWQSMAGEQPEFAPKLTFEVTAQGELSHPPPVARRATEPQPLDLASLTEQQATLWKDGRAALQGDPGPQLLEICRNFMHSKPPQEFGGRLLYEAGSKFKDSKQWPEARELFLGVVAQFPAATDSAGLPLLPQAHLAVLEVFAAESSRNRFQVNVGFNPSSLPPVSVDTLCRSLLEQPSALTEPLLQELLLEAGRLVEQDQIPKWQAEQVKESRARWERQQLERRLYSAARGHLGSEPAKATAFWVSQPDAPSAFAESYFVTRSRVGSTNHQWFSCRTEAELGAMVTKAVTGRKIPEYLGVTAEAAGRRIIRFAPPLGAWHFEQYMTKSGGGAVKKTDENATPELLVSEAKVLQGTDVVRVNVYLTSPDGLLKRQQTRSFWLFALVAASAAAALLGVVGAYHTYVRQLQVSAMKSNFVASVSHEVRSPIASIRLMAESLAGGRVPAPERQADYFRLIGLECRRLSALTENVLDLARIERKEKQFEFEPTDLLMLVQQTLELLQAQAAERGVALTLSVREADREALSTGAVVDGKAVQQALINLLDNAIKHSPAGKQVVVGLETASPAGHAEPARLLLWVEDQGEGIPPQEQKRVFETFYRCGTELTRKTAGVGIGLSIVRHVAEAHEGQVHLRSAPGTGSRFTIDLPFRGASPQSSSKTSRDNE